MSPPCAIGTDSSLSLEGAFLSLAGLSYGFYLMAFFTPVPFLGVIVTVI